MGRSNKRSDTRYGESQSENSRAVRETQNKHEKESDGQNKAGETAPMAFPLLATHHCFTALLFPAI